MGEIEDKVLRDIKDLIATLPVQYQDQVGVAKASLSYIVKTYGDAGKLALTLLGATLAAQGD